MSLSRRLCIVSIAVFCLLMAGCRQATKPQRPLHRGEQPPVDSALLSMMMLNERLADEADKVITRYLNDHDQQGYQMDCGAWRISPLSHTSDTLTPQKGEQWTITMDINDLQGQSILFHEQTITYPSQDLPPAVTEAITTMHHGDSATVVCPWYAAFGSIGNAYIKPYTNCVIYIYLE